MPPEINPTSITTTKSKREFILLLVLGLILIAINLCFLYKTYFVKEVVIEEQNLNTNIAATTTDEFANWKKYRNEEYGFEFKYPENVYVSQTPTGVIEVIDIKNKNSQYGPFPGIWIYIENNKSNLSLIDWWNQKDGSKEGYVLTYKKINGIEAIHLSGTEGLLENHTILAYKGNIFDFSISAGLLSDEILSTFKFTK